MIYSKRHLKGLPSPKEIVIKTCPILWTCSRRESSPITSIVANQPTIMRQFHRHFGAVNVRLFK